jgi:hypothetical protein
MVANMENIVAFALCAGFIGAMFMPMLSTKFKKKD